MREIKFRAWDGSKMHLPEYSDKEDFFLMPDGTISYIKEVGVEGHELTFIRPDTWVIEQYTGLRDRNGKEIYEGDIVQSVPTGSRWTGSLMVVVFRYGSFGMHHVGANRYCSFIGHLDYAVTKNYCEPEIEYLSTDMQFVEIIGNIHENPDLLKA